MTLTSCALALAAIAAPEPESRLTSSSTVAPFVIACSACCCWVALSPSAFWISASIPAASNACWRNGRSPVSQRTDDFESGSRTATLPASSPPPPAAPPPPSSSSSPQPANTSAPAAAITAAICHALFCMVLLLLLGGLDMGPSGSGRLSREAGRERAIGLRDDESNRAQHLCSLPEHTRHHAGRLGGRGQRRARDRLAHAVQQQVAGLRQVAAHHQQLRVEDVEQHRHRLPDRPPGVRDDAPAAEVAGPRQIQHPCDGHVRAVAVVQQFHERARGRKRLQAAAVAAPA